MVKKMVIAKPEWFKKKNKGYLISRITWQGTVYMLATASVLFVGMTLPPTLINEIIVTAVFLFLIMDAQIATWNSLDEREQIHTAIAMRNMAWGMIIILVASMVIISNFDITLKDFYKIIMLIAIGGAMINFITRYKLQREN